MSQSDKSLVLRVRAGWVFALAMLLLSSGCSTTAVTRSKGLAAAGITYSKTLSEASDLALDIETKYAANELAKTSRSKQLFDGLSSELRTRDELTRQTKFFLSEIGRYFEALEELASTDTSKEAEQSLQNISNSLNKSLLENSKSENDIKAASGLAALVIQKASSDRLAKALRRDASIIAVAIKISNERLELQLKIIEDRQKRLERDYWTESVENPYFNNQVLDTKWKAAWIQGVRKSEISEIVSNSLAASRKMSEVWESVLREDVTASELLALLSQAQKGLNAIEALHAKEAKESK